MANQAITERQLYWLKHLKAIESGGETTSGYAKRQGLKAKDLYQWKTRLTRLGFYKSVEAASSFVAVKPTGPRKLSSQPKDTRCVLIFSNGIRFEFEESVSPAVIREVVNSVSTRY